MLGDDEKELSEDAQQNIADGVTEHPEPYTADEIYGSPNEEDNEPTEPAERADLD